MNRTIFSMVAMAALVLWAGSAVADSSADMGDDGIVEDLNIGEGSQTNANNWEDMGDTNAGGNQLTGGGVSSNGGDRISDDIAVLLGEDAEVASYALDVSVTENSLSVGMDGRADALLEFSAESGFENSYGVTAVTVNAGSSASQSVSVNVTSAVSM